MVAAGQAAVGLSPGQQQQQQLEQRGQVVQMPDLDRLTRLFVSYTNRCGLESSCC